MTEFSKTGDGAAAAKFYHTQGVIVEKGKNAKFGREEIAKMYNEFWEKIGPHNFVMSNETYQGTDDYLIIASDFESHSEKGTGDFKGKFIHIWKKEDGQWTIYHEEFELN
ncbi:hypothetical protein TELCIR_00177 [Teladorsagia circumcincta]|uniref:DUF4440 domain-containing protein n=1 Tax=Teladorsagia circumcincta TaxID=45464 RepID=A0A2G9V7G9_TELCI|nr:hypothetical protein TELCIR_00177 [Teladorsagia circumcincta]